jgi:hypothetical protein
VLILVCAQVGPVTGTRTNSRLTRSVAAYLDENPLVIYISFGTRVALNAAQVSHIVSTASALMWHSFLWSLPYDQMHLLHEAVGGSTNIPSNLKVVDWVDQALVLRHPHVRAYYSHGGANSIHEAIATAVPILCTPFVSDQVCDCLSLSLSRSVAIYWCQGLVINTNCLMILVCGLPARPGTKDWYQAISRRDECRDNHRGAHRAAGTRVCDRH